MNDFGRNKEEYSKWQTDFEQLRLEHYQKMCKLCNGYGKTYFQQSYYSPLPNGGCDYIQPPQPVKVKCPHCEGSGYEPVPPKFSSNAVIQNIYNRNAPRYVQSSEQTQGQNPS